MTRFTDDLLTPMIKCAQSPAPTHRYRRMACGWGIMTIGAVLTYFAFFPGLMSPDAYDQIQQARTNHFTDWHPPMMAWLWSLINHLIPGPQGFFILLILLYWGGFSLICTRCSYGTGKRFLGAVILPFLPFLINFAGTIGKDEFVFGCFLTGLGLILLRPRRRILRVAAGSAIILLLLVGSLARYNSVLAAIPLVVLWIWPSPTPVRRVASLARQLALSGAVILLVWWGAWNTFNRYVAHAEAQQVQSSLFAWQLLNISHLTRQNLIPGNWTPAETREIVDRCYDPGSLNVLHFRCHFITDELHRSGEWQSGLLTAFLRVSVAHPIQYLETRLVYLHTLAWPDQIFVYRGGPLSLAVQNNDVFKLMSNAFTWLQSAPVIHYMFTLLFWIAISMIVGITYLFLWIRGYNEFYEMFLISLSAVLYICPLVVIGIDGDFRYGYWAVAATCISILLWPDPVRLAARGTAQT